MEPLTHIANETSVNAETSHQGYLIPDYCDINVTFICDFRYTEINLTHIEC